MGGLGKNLKMVSLRHFNPLISKHINWGYIKWLFKCSKINKLGNFGFCHFDIFWPTLTYTTFFFLFKFISKMCEKSVWGQHFQWLVFCMENQSKNIDHAQNSSQINSAVFILNPWTVPFSVSQIARHQPNANRMWISLFLPVW